VVTKDYRNYVNGTFSKQASSALLEVLNPATNETIGHVPNSSPTEVDAAVAAASIAQAGWERLPAIQRAGYLRKISEKVRKNKERLAELITREQGKVLSLAQVEVDFTADYIDYMAEWARRIEGEVITSDRPNETILLLRKAVGVVAGIHQAERGNAAQRIRFRRAGRRMRLAPWGIQPRRRWPRDRCRAGGASKCRPRLLHR
jgi:lactaldehyde dehydrogenase/glycolaldehyde dehydrogenase